MTKGDRLTPSLLEPQSRGGDIAEGGFSFQDHLILARIPIWLAQEGFTAMVKEGIGDAEAKFFTPDRGFIKDLIEVKDHVLQPAEFWSEIKRFQEIDTGSPGTYRNFILIGTGASKELQPIVNALRRVRDSHTFYDRQDAVQQNSIQDFVQLVEGKGASEQNAHFLLDKVIVETEWNTAKPHGEAVFKQTLADHLEEYTDLSIRTLDDIYNHLNAFVRQQRSQTISRKQLEAKLREKIPVHHQPPSRPILIYTAIAPEDNPNHAGLRFDWTALSPPEQWNLLVSELQNTRTWIENYRNTKRIRLLGNRRLSACLAIGATFSAVRGYVIELDYRGEIWATDAHPTSETLAYPLTHQLIEPKDDSGQIDPIKALVVSLSIYRNILPEVQAYLNQLNPTNLPLLDIHGDQPINSPQQANLVAGRLKKLIIQALQHTKCQEIHLFYAGPAHVALFLGHRLDATAPVICYGWAENRQYSRTCRLFSS